MQVGFKIVLDLLEGLIRKDTKKLAHGQYEAGEERQRETDWPRKLLLFINRNKVTLGKIYELTNGIKTPQS